MRIRSNAAGALPAGAATPTRALRIPAWLMVSVVWAAVTAAASLVWITNGRYDLTDTFWGACTVLLTAVLACIMAPFVRLSGSLWEQEHRVTCITLLLACQAVTFTLGWFILLSLYLLVCELCLGNG